MICASKDFWSGKKITRFRSESATAAARSLNRGFRNSGSSRSSRWRDRAREAVESGEITIVPENYQQIYLNWMDNIHDWCVSRQLWWGHRIPAWIAQGARK